MNTEGNDSKSEIKFPLSDENRAEAPSAWILSELHECPMSRSKIYTPVLAMPNITLKSGTPKQLRSDVGIIKLPTTRSQMK